jgi:NF-kappa-B inhibitor alpha
MWEQTMKDCTDRGADADSKQRVDSQGDSGFLSGSNLLGSELNIDLESEERKDEANAVKIAPEPARAIDSGLDLGLSNTLSQLTLKEENLDPLDSGTIHPDNEELAAQEVKSEVSQEPWEIYYTQDDDGDT